MKNTRAALQSAQTQMCAGATKIKFSQGVQLSHREEGREIKFQHPEAVSSNMYTHSCSKKANREFRNHLSIYHPVVGLCNALTSECAQTLWRDKAACTSLRAHLQQIIDACPR